MKKSAASANFNAILINKFDLAETSVLLHIIISNRIIIQQRKAGYEVLTSKMARDINPH